MSHRFIVTVLPINYYDDKSFVFLFFVFVFVFFFCVHFDVNLVCT
jgi:hypothetical protein